MIAEGQNDIVGEWWTLTVPGIPIIIVGIVSGDGLVTHVRPER